MLLIFCLITIVIMIGGFIAFKMKNENLRYNINKLIYKIIYSTIIVGIGQILCLIGLMPKIEYVYFNAVMFILIIGALIAYGFLVCLMFEKIILPILQNCKYIQFVVFLELFLLSITKHLELLEWVAGTLGIVGIEILIILLEKLMSTQQKKKEKEKRKEDDYPNPDLYPTRRKQLEKFVTVLKQQEHEPYAVMISGEWGVGKSSFIQALEKRLDENSFIWVYAGSEKTVLETMSDISAKILEVLKKNNVFIENKSSIESYFLAFSDLMEDTALKPLKKISNVLMRGKNYDDREYLNCKLDDLSKPIYLIIDDLDRCDSEYQVKMFKVIRESMELHNCKTIFLVDRNKFLNEKYDTNYIEKYVSYTLDLCEVEYKEIVNYLMADIFDYKFIQEMNTVLLKDRGMAQIREMIYGFPINLLEKLENELSKEEDSIRNKKGDEIKRGQEKIEDFESVIFRIKKNITISRKLKNYLKGIKRDIVTLNDGIENGSEEFLNEDWLEAIIEVQFVKNFMPEIFNEIKMSREIFEFGRKYQGYIIDVVFGLHYDFLIHNEKKEAILNYLIYKIDVIEFAKVKTMKEKYLSELRNDKIVISNIERYIELIETYDDLDKILHIYKKQMFDNNVSQENFISKIFEFLSKRASPFKANTKEFLDFSKQLVACLMETGLTDKGKILCVSEGNLVVRRAIVDNAREFINILSILFNVTTVKNNWSTLMVTDVNEFYEVLKKIDKESRFMGLEDEVNKLLSIRTYFWNLEVELRKEKYKGVGLDLEKLFSDIKIIFEICEFWDDIEYTLNDSGVEENALLIKKYFLLENGYSFRDEVFDDVTNLAEALKILKEFYLTKENNYESDYSLLLLRLSYHIVLQYEENLAWFREKKKEIAKLLMETAEVACRLDKARDYYAKDDIAKIKIYTYKFNEYCGNELSTKNDQLILNNRKGVF